MGHISTRDMFEILSELRTTEGKLDNLMRFAESDLVKPVRCKDCKWLRRYKGGEDGNGLYCGLFHRNTNKNDYCSHGRLEVDIDA